MYLLIITYTFLDHDSPSQLVNEKFEGYINILYNIMTHIVISHNNCILYVVGDVYTLTFYKCLDDSVSINAYPIL